MEQYAIGLLGLSAIWITQQSNATIKIWAPVLGLMSQPFWFYSSWQAEQWGIFIVSIGYTGCWILGIYNNWGNYAK